MPKFTIDVVDGFAERCEHAGLTMTAVVRRVLEAWTADGAVREAVDAAMRRIADHRASGKAGPLPPARARVESVQASQTTGKAAPRVVENRYTREETEAFRWDTTTETASQWVARVDGRPIPEGAVPAPDGFRHPGVPAGGFPQLFVYPAWLDREVFDGDGWVLMGEGDKAPDGFACWAPRDGEPSSGKKGFWARAGRVQVLRKTGVVPGS